MSQQTLSPRAAWGGWLLITAMGLFFFLLAVGVVGSNTGESDDTPRWIGLCAGLVFLLGGAAPIISFAVAGGAWPDGDLPPDTSWGIRPQTKALIMIVFSNVLLDKQAIVPKSRPDQASVGLIRGVRLPREEYPKPALARRGGAGRHVVSRPFCHIADDSGCRRRCLRFTGAAGTNATRGPFAVVAPFAPPSPQRKLRTRTQSLPSRFATIY
jgi:hypothetical protein